MGSCCCPHDTGCTTYCVVEKNTLGDPVSGSTVTLDGTLSGSPWSVSGTTDGSGSWCYTPTGDPLPVVTSATCCSPDPTCCATTTNSIDVDGTCTFYFTLCTRQWIITTVDGESGGGLDGVTLGGPFYLEPCNEECNPDISSPVDVVAGSVHTFTAYSIYDTFYGTGCYQPLFLGAVACLEGYWGGCLTVNPTDCETTYTATVNLWSRTDWLLNVLGLCASDRPDVYNKTLCLAFTGPSAVMGSVADSTVTVTFDSGSWDGSPCQRYTAPGVYNVMRWTGCFDAGSAAGMCGFLDSNGCFHGSSESYVSILVVVTLTPNDSGPPSLVVTVTPCWTSDCDPTVTPTCTVDGTDYPYVPGLYCYTDVFVDGLGDVCSGFQFPRAIQWTFWECPDSPSICSSGQFLGLGPIDLFGPAICNPPCEFCNSASGWCNSCRCYNCNTYTYLPCGVHEGGTFADCDLPEGTVTITEGPSCSYGDELVSPEMPIPPYLVADVPESSPKRRSWFSVN